MKKFFKALAIIIAIILSCTPLTAFAESSNNEDIYVEYYNKINFTDIDYAISNSNKLLLSVKNSENTLKKSKAEKDISVLKEYFKNNKSAELDFIRELENDNTIMAISYTIAPLIWNTDHYDRVLKTNNSTYAAAPSTSGNTSSKGYFTMQTTISKTTTSNSAGEYKYTTQTKGYWSESSYKGGSDYPASGDDFIIQSVPNTMKISSDSLAALYHYYIGTTDNYYGRLGKEYYREDGGDNFVKYSVEDDPLGLNQLESVKLNTVTWGKPSTSTRKINSYYVHTWTSMSVKVSIGASTSSEVTLSITPEKESKSWKLYSYVTFNF
ncbi:MAG: hypothetical protein K1V95_03630 [Eubacterium sp.]